MYKIRDNGEVYLYDAITDGITARKLLQEIPDGDEDLSLHINSSGGDVFEAIYVYNLLKSRGNVKVYVDGICASAASIIAMSGSRVIMNQGTMMMIHNPVSSITGTSAELQDMAGLLDKITMSIAGIYMQKTGLAQEKILDLMAAETWMHDYEAKELGFCDDVNRGETPRQQNLKTYEDGVREERARIKALDQIRTVRNAAMIDDAKYKTPRSADSIALELLKMEAYSRDAESVPVMLKEPDGIRDIASIINEARGWR
ncbi:MAG: Clp protease ClpP [Synergistaceae bacterium]|nr:Clp protease ClpP [Synergistaceae bacterium]MBQ6971802.1 Clp protease ClpP [Synergistaceae bacterium]